MFRAIAGVCAVLLLTGAAAAQDAAPSPVCTAPSPPAIERPVKPARPAVPGCVNEERGTHNCRGNVLSAYNASMERYGAAFDAYVAGINAYIAKLNAYSAAAIEYTQCEQRTVAPRALITG